MTRALVLAALLSACTIGQSRTVEQRVVELDLDGQTLVDLETASGELEIVGEAERTSLTMDVTLVRWGGVRPDQDGIDGLVATLEAQGDRVMAKAFVELTGTNPFSTDVVLRVPLGFDVVVDDASGDMKIRDVGAAEITDESGEILVENAARRVDIDDDSGEIEVFGAAGLTIRDDSGNIDAVDIEGDVRIEDDSGEIAVLDVVGNVVIDDESGGIDVQQVDGDVDVTDDSGDIYVADVTGTVTVDDASGDIHVVRVGDFDLRSDGSGDVRIE